MKFNILKHILKYQSGGSLTVSAAPQLIPINPIDYSNLFKKREKPEAPKSNAAKTKALDFGKSDAGKMHTEDFNTVQSMLQEGNNLLLSDDRQEQQQGLAIIGKAKQYENVAVNDYARYEHTTKVNPNKLSDDELIIGQSGSLYKIENGKLVIKSEEDYLKDIQQGEKSYYVTESNFYQVRNSQFFGNNPVMNELSQAYASTIGYDVIIEKSKNFKLGNESGTRSINSSNVETNKLAEQFNNLSGFANETGVDQAVVYDIIKTTKGNVPQYLNIAKRELTDYKNTLSALEKDPIKNKKRIDEYKEVISSLETNLTSLEERNKKNDTRLSNTNLPNIDAAASSLRDNLSAGEKQRLHYAAIEAIALSPELQTLQEQIDTESGKPNPDKAKINELKTLKSQLITAKENSLLLSQYISELDETTLYEYGRTPIVKKAGNSGGGKSNRSLKMTKFYTQLIGMGPDKILDFSKVLNNATGDLKEKRGYSIASQVFGNDFSTYTSNDISKSSSGTPDSYDTAPRSTNSEFVKQLSGGNTISLLGTNVEINLKDPTVFTPVDHNNYPTILTVAAYTINEKGELGKVVEHPYLEGSKNLSDKDSKENKETSLSLSSIYQPSIALEEADILSLIDFKNDTSERKELNSVAGETAYSLVRELVTNKKFTGLYNFIEEPDKTTIAGLSAQKNIKTKDLKTLLDIILRNDATKTKFIESVENRLGQAADDVFTITKLLPKNSNIVKAKTKLVAKIISKIPDIKLTEEEAYLLASSVLNGEAHYKNKFINKMSKEQFNELETFIKSDLTDDFQTVETGVATNYINLMLDATSSKDDLVYAKSVMTKVKVMKPSDNSFWSYIFGDGGIPHDNKVYEALAKLSTENMASQADIKEYKAALYYALPDEEKKRIVPNGDFTNPDIKISSLLPIGTTLSDAQKNNLDLGGWKFLTGTIVYPLANDLNLNFIAGYEPNMSIDVVSLGNNYSQFNFTVQSGEDDKKQSDK